MKHTIIFTYCDWPGCAETWLKEHRDEEQFTTKVDFSLSAAKTRGRKPKAKPILLCSTHYKELADLRRTLTKNKQLSENLVGT